VNPSTAWTICGSGSASVALDSILGCVVTTVTAAAASGDSTITTVPSQSFEGWHRHRHRQRERKEKRGQRIKNRRYRQRHSTTSVMKRALPSVFAGASCSLPNQAGPNAAGNMVTPVQTARAYSGEPVAWSVAAAAV